MHSTENPFYGLPTQELIDLLQVDRSTFHRWRTGKSQPPASAVMVARIWINGELVQGGSDWTGWRFNRKRELCAPTGDSFTASEVAAIPYWIRCARFRTLTQEPEQLRLAFG